VNFDRNRKWEETGLNEWILCSQREKTKSMAPEKSKAF